MLASIDDFALADGSFAGGVALSQIRINVQRIFDIVVPLQTLDPVLYDRGVRKTVVDFQVFRVHDSIAAAEIYIIDHDLLVPDSGQVQFSATDGTIRYMFNAALFTHQRIGVIGETTLHQYHIEGGRILGVSGFFVLTEPGDYVLEEDGGSKIKLQNG